MSWCQACFCTAAMRSAGCIAVRSCHLLLVQILASSIALSKKYVGADAMYIWEVQLEEVCHEV